MSGNLDFVRSVVAAHERGDYASADWADPEIEYVIADGPDAGVFRGRAAMAKAWRTVLSAYRDYSNVVEEIREIDDERVLVLGSFKGGGKASGIGASGMRTGAALYQVRNGRVIRHALYFDRDNALADLGLKERGMSRENVELVRSISAAHERGDYGSAEWAHPDIEYVIVGGPTPGIWKGRAAMARAAGELFSVWDEHRTVVEEVRSLDGERVLVLGHGSGRGKASGVELDAAQWQVAALYQVRDGKVIRHVAYMDRADAFADLGLEE